MLSKINIVLKERLPVSVNVSFKCEHKNDLQYFTSHIKCKFKLTHLQVIKKDKEGQILEIPM